MITKSKKNERERKGAKNGENKIAFIFLCFIENFHIIIATFRSEGTKNNKTLFCHSEFGIFKYFYAFKYLNG